MNARGDSERGVTMVELVIGMAIGAVVATLAVYMFISAFSAQAGVTSSTAVSTRGQVISEMINKAMRNAVAAEVVGSGSQLDIERSDGTCESFRAGPASVGAPTSIQHRVFTSSTKATAAWTDLLSYQSGASFRADRIPSASPSPYFATPSASATPAHTAVTYSFRLVGANGAVDVVSLAGPRTPVRSTSTCF